MKYFNNQFLWDNVLTREYSLNSTFNLHSPTEQTWWLAKLYWVFPLRQYSLVLTYGRGLFRSHAYFSAEL